MNKYNPSKGDMIFLFEKLSIDIVLENFIFSNGIKVIRTPKEIIENPLGDEKPQTPNEKIALTNLIYPSYYLPGSGFKHLCLVAPSSCKDQSRDIWIILGILRLIKPLHIFIMSKFIFNGKIIKITQIMQETRLNKESFCHKGLIEHYKLEDLNHVNKLLPKINTILIPQTKYPQLKQAISHFFQATLWEKWHYTTTGFQKLFPGIDCLFGNPEWKHKNKISSRIDNWLKGSIKHGNAKITYLTSLFNYLWDTYRPPAAHGHPPNTSEIDSDIDSNKACFCIHELLRLSLLKMLDLDDKTLSEYEEIFKNDDEKSKNQKLDNFFKIPTTYQFSKESNKSSIDHFLKDIL